MMEPTKRTKDRKQTQRKVLSMWTESRMQKKKKKKQEKEEARMPS